MKISIVTSCFNREKTIRSTIESVLSQDYDDIEYIVVDAASTDSTLSIINEYRDKINVIISEVDSGMYEGLNKGIKLATGDIIGMLHSDDVFYATDTLSLVVHEFNRTKADLVYGNGIFVSNTNSNEVVRDWVSGQYLKRRVKRGWLPLHTTVFVRREMFDLYGYYDEQYKIAADSDWLVRLLYKHTIKVSYINEYLIRMRMGGISTSFHKTKQKWIEDMKHYRCHGLNPVISLSCKILSKMPQFIFARLKRIIKRWC